MSHVIVKNNKFFQDGVMGKEAFVEAADSLFPDLKIIDSGNYKKNMFIVNYYVCCAMLTHSIMRGTPTYIVHTKNSQYS